MIMMPNRPAGVNPQKAGLSSLEHFVALEGVSYTRI
jgi:hypothetical protein